MGTTTDNVLNVTLLDPRVKHPTIFARIDELNGGESLIIHNDHDPKPLYYQLLSMRGNVFDWEYLEEGPEWWKIKITMHEDDDEGETLGELVTQDVRFAQVFKKYGLDFCCGGNQTIKAACREAGVDYTQVELDLRNIDEISNGARAIPFNTWPVDFLADYIINTHHSYVRNVSEDIKKYAAKVATVHGHNHPELHEINHLIVKVIDAMDEHMVDEENNMFPYIKELVSANKKGEKLPAPSFGTVKSQIDELVAEHEIVGADVDKIREISNNFALPADACASYTLLFKMLDEFDDDIHLHVHLENNILFPKTAAMEI